MKWPRLWTRTPAPIVADVIGRDAVDQPAPVVVPIGPICPACGEASAIWHTYADGTVHCGCGRQGGA